MTFVLPKPNLDYVSKSILSVCGKGVGSNSIRCTGCSGWVHKRCSGVKGSLVRAEDTFVQDVRKR